MNHKNIFLLGIFILLTACNFSPEYQVPDMEVPESYNISGLKWNELNPSDDLDRGDWWTIYHDKQLNMLEEKLNQDNFNIKSAMAQYNESVALVDEARAAFFPTINATMAGIKQRNATTAKISATRTLTFNASWEPDLWGAVASDVEASVAASEAEHASLESVRLSAQASLAQYYFEFCSVSSDDKTLHNIVNTYNKNLDYIRSRYKEGVVGQADILQAENQLKAAEAQLINNKINLEVYSHAIAVLVGEHPSIFKLEPCSYDIKMHNIPVGIPSTLLERRPDIAQAERLLAQANAEIGVAKSAYFPDMSLSIAQILQGNGVQNILSLPLSAWSLGSSITQSILAGGAQVAATTAAEEKYNSNVASYRQTVLAAFQDVEDSIATLHHLRDQEKVQAQSTKNAKAALQLVENQYKAGVVDYASVLSSKIAFYTSSKDTADLKGLRIASEIGLIKSLGGMWSSTK